MANRRSTLRLGRLAGVPIGVQPLWLVIVGLITFVLGHDYFPAEDPGLSSGAAYVLGLVSALALFAGILLHELGHAVVARGRGVEVDEIDLWLLGGVARLHGEPRRPGDELRFALAGPAVTAGLLAVAVTLRLAAGGALPEWGRAALDYQVYVNALILGFNLLPAFPLDGGRVARALLWRRSGDRERATDQAASIGRAFGIILTNRLAAAARVPARRTRGGGRPGRSPRRAHLDHRRPAPTARGRAPAGRPGHAGPRRLTTIAPFSARAPSARSRRAVDHRCWTGAERTWALVRLPGRVPAPGHGTGEIERRDTVDDRGAAA